MEGSMSQLGEVHEDGFVVLWTDGAGRNNQDSLPRRAGAGVFYAPLHVGNCACAVPGHCQTDQWAELLAVVLALQKEARAVEIRTDSQWVLDGATAWISWAKAGGWATMQTYGSSSATLCLPGPSQ